jgi:hypothetical protein
LVYLFDSQKMPTERWERFKAIVGPMFTVDVNYKRAEARRLSLQGLATYGPNGASLPGSGQQAWTVQRDQDMRHWVATEFADVRSMTPLCDSRPRKGVTVTYGDQPTQPEWVEHVEAALSGNPKLVLIYARNEYDESGGTTGTSFRDGTRFNDGLRWARGAPPPPSYFYEIDAHSMKCTGSGAWSYDFPSGGIDGAFNSDEVLSSEAFATKALTHPRALGFALYATTGPDRGIATVQLDGATVATVDFYSRTLQRHVAVWTSDPLDGSDHTVQVTLTGKRRRASSSAAIGLDSFGVTYAP